MDVSLMGRMKELKNGKPAAGQYVEAQLKADIVAEALAKKPRPSRRREVARWALEEWWGSIRLACEALGLSESAYRYHPQLNAENLRIAAWLVRLTDNHRSWGFGLFCLYLRNVQDFQWNHKRVYRIYREPELNLRIRSRKRLVRAKPEALAVPCAINQTRSMDFMHDKLEDGRSFRLLNSNRRLQPGGVVPRGGLLVAGRARHPHAGPGDRVARETLCASP